MALLTALTAYVSANVMGISVRLVPVVLFAGIILVQWYTSSSLQRAGLVVVAIGALVVALDIAGKLPAVVEPKGPAAPASVDK